MLSAMGCEKFQITPGIFSSSRSIAAISASLSWWNAGRHCSFGFRSTKYSVLKKPVVSVPSSGRPTWLVVVVTSGNEPQDHAPDSPRDALGRPRARRQRAAHPDRAFIQMRKKLGSDGAAQQTVPARIASATPTVAQRHRIATRSAGRNRASARPSAGLCHSLVPLGNTMLASTGPDEHREHQRAEQREATVHAIGLNNRPSTACSVKIGR